MLVFSNSRGRVARVIPTDSSEIASLSFPGFDFTRRYAIISANQLRFSVNHQVMDTIGGDVYLTSFGEAMTPIGFSGQLFTSICDDSFASTGPERLMEWWQTQNLSNRRQPVNITYGFNTAISGFVVGLDITTNNARDRLWNFSLAMLKVPFRPQIEDSRFAEASSDVATTDTAGAAADAGGGDFIQQTPSGSSVQQVEQFFQQYPDRLSVPVTYNPTLTGSATPRVLLDPLGS